MASQCVVSEPEQSFEEMLNSVQQTLAGKGLGANQGNSSGDGSGGGTLAVQDPPRRSFGFPTWTPLRKAMQILSSERRNRREQWRTIAV